jgi:hypothetical protein
MQQYEDIFIQKANIFYILTMFVIKEEKDEVILNIGLARRSGLDSVKFIREYIITKKIVDCLEFTLLDSTKEIVSFCSNLLLSMKSRIDLYLSLFDLSILL